MGTAKKLKNIIYALDASELGGKAYNLLRIKNVRHAKFFVLGASFFNSLEADYGKKLDAVNAKLASFLRQNKKYAVRSSAIGEDSSQHSFAGIMDSFLNVECGDVTKAVIDCYNSAYADRAIEYRKLNNLPSKEDEIHSAVIVQEMVKADFAGVINTINPITNNPSETLISIVKGLGESLVSGKDNSIDFIIDNNGIGGHDFSTVPKSIVYKIYILSQKVQAQCDRFQDIEFAVADGKVYFLQTRDIVPYSHIDLSKHKTVLDNANIIESFYGVVSPLTFSFVKEMYRDVYTAALEQMGISKKVLLSLKPYLENMLYFYKHRIYYNLNSWYKLVGIYPWANKSARRMERMMGFSIASQKTRRIKLGVIDTLKFVYNFMRRLKNIEADSQRFLDDFYKAIYPYSISDFAAYSSGELGSIYKNVASKTMSWYTTPVVNDNGAMAAYAKLTKFVSKLNICDKEGFISSLFIDVGGVESAESAQLFNNIVDIINSDDQIRNDFLELEASDIYGRYHTNSMLSEAIKTYINKFGARVTDELKFETVTMLQDSLILYTLLKMQLGDNPNKQRVKIDKTADLEIEQLSGMKKTRFKKLVEKAAYFIRNRERLRLTRTHTFSAIRNILLKLGELFFNDGIIDAPNDIFFLTKQEVLLLAEGKRIEQVKELVAMRKKDYSSAKNIDVADKIVIYGDNPLEVLNIDYSDSGLKGIPSGAGVVKGIVKLVENPSNAIIKGDIILAKRTDPGWITLFPLCSGLIVEYGSVLSHSAVVAREMGIPAVVGLKNATSRIPNGALVTLDAIKGEVLIHE